MKSYLFPSVLLFLAVWAAVGCNQSKNNDSEAGDKGPSADKDRYLLTREPPDAKGVLEVRKNAKDGEAILVVGRIGGSVRPMVEGRASFTIVDPSLVPCSEKEGDSCETPWDFCCDQDQLARSMVMVKFVDDQGKSIPQDAKDLLGVKLLQTVVIRGKAKRDAEGNLVIVANQLFIRP